MEDAPPGPDPVSPSGTTHSLTVESAYLRVRACLLPTQVQAHLIDDAHCHGCLLGGTAAVGQTG